MKKYPSAKQVVRFVLLTSLAIALVTYGILKTISISISTGITAHSDRQAVPAVRRRFSRIDQLLPMADGFKVTAEGVSSRNFDVTIAGKGTAGPFRYTRRLITVTVPNDTPQDVIRTNMIAIARKAFENGMRTVRVCVFREDDPWGHMGAIGSLTFAPYGKWEVARTICNLTEYRAVIDDGSSLQKSKQKVPVLIRFVDTEPAQQGAEEKK